MLTAPGLLCVHTFAWCCLRAETTPISQAPQCMWHLHQLLCDFPLDSFAIPIPFRTYFGQFCFALECFSTKYIKPSSSRVVVIDERIPGVKQIFGFVFKTHVVVNSIPSDLALNRGPLCQAILEKAGPEIQQELNTALQGVAVDVGTVLQTRGYNLQCDHVLHVVAPAWGTGDAQKVGLALNSPEDGGALWSLLSVYYSLDLFLWRILPSWPFF